MRDGRLRLDRIARRLEPKSALKIFRQGEDESRAAFRARVDAEHTAAGPRSRRELWILVTRESPPEPAEL
jgi:hypothetical protein